MSPSKVTVAEYLEGWLPSARARLRPGSYDASEFHVRGYIVPLIGDVPLQALSPTKVKAMYAELRRQGRRRGGGGLSPKTIHNVHRTLSRALQDAVTDQLLPRNPADRAHRQPESPEMPTWSAEQLRVFDRVASDGNAALWRLAATTGMRRGELAGPRWSDVDFAAARITIVRQRAKGAGTVSSEADEDAPESPAQAPRSPPHPRHPDLRAGVHPKVVQERLGHSSIAITLDTYSHAIPSMQEDAAARVAALVDDLEERGEARS